MSNTNHSRHGKFGLAALAAALLIGGCSDIDALAPEPTTDRVLARASALTTNTHNEFSSTFFNTCTGELMAFHIVQHVVVTETTDAAGGWHYHFRYTAGPAYNVGLTTGTVYHAQSNYNYMESTLASGVSQVTVVRNRPFSGQGRAPDWDLHYSAHLTISADGVTISDPQNLFVTCK